MPTNCDALIVGGGPAGGLAARQLSQAGLSVILLEALPVLRERVCGAYLCPAGVALLDELELRSQLTAGMPELYGMVLVSPSGRRLRTHFPADTRLPHFGISLHRPRFDECLLQAAANFGAEIRMGARLQSARRIPDGWQAELADGRRISTRLLVGADGRKSRVARLLGLAAPPWQERVALHVDIASEQPTEPFGEMHVFPDGTYIGLNPVGPRTWNISALCDPAELKRTSPLDFINERTQASAHLRHRIAALTDAAAVRATFPAAANVRAVVAANAALIGDASGFIDPLTGEGIYQALWTACALANEVTAAQREPAALALALQRYARRRQRQYRGKRLCSRAFQAIIQRPNLSDAVLNVLAWRAGIGNSFIGLIGNIYSPAQAGWNMIKALS